MGLRVGLTWAGPGGRHACSQHSSSRVTQASRVEPFPRQALLPSSRSRRPARGSSRAAKPRQASALSCGDTEPRVTPTLPPARSPLSSLEGSRSRGRTVTTRWHPVLLVPGPRAGRQFCAHWRPQGDWWPRRDRGRRGDALPTGLRLGCLAAGADPGLALRGGGGVRGPAARGAGERKEMPRPGRAFGGASLPPESHTRPPAGSSGAAASIVTDFRAGPSPRPHGHSRVRGPGRRDTLRPSPCGAPRRSCKLRDQRPRRVSTLMPERVPQAQCPVPVLSSGSSVRLGRPSACCSRSAAPRRLPGHPGPSAPSFPEPQPRPPAPRTPHPGGCPHTAPPPRSASGS